MKKIVLTLAGTLLCSKLFCWGFFAHQRINYYAVFLLPPEMMVLYKPNIGFLSSHAVDPDKRRYILPQEGARHFIDIDHYGQYPYPGLPRNWEEAKAKFSEDSLNRHGIVPWWILVEKQRLTLAFRNKDREAILKLSADIGHYIGDAHVPLHACSNHNGQLSGQEGIHAFWESRIPELLAEQQWDFFIGKADYIRRPLDYIWQRVLESAAAADTVLREEKALRARYPEAARYTYAERNGRLVHTFSPAYSLDYESRLHHMIERRMRESVYAVASFWYTAWVDAGQPDLKLLVSQSFSEKDILGFSLLDEAWKKAGGSDSADFSER